MAKTVAFFPEPGAWGPTNNLVAIAEVLRERGWRSVFVIEESFRGEMAKRGFDEALIRLSPAPEGPEAVGEGWAEFIRETAPEFRKSTFVQLQTVTLPIWEELVGGARYAHERLMEIWSDIRPDLIVSDNVLGFPAVPLSGLPWVRMVSANPLEMDDELLPPALSGLPTADSTQWEAFKVEFLRLHEPLITELSNYNVSVGADPLPAGKFQYVSPFANLYLYPEVLDYKRQNPLDDTWHRLDTTVRVGDEAFDVNEWLPGDGKVIYLSMGSLGSNDVQLMQRLVDALDETEHRVIVSMGPLHEQLRLGPRMYGREFLPQPSILPQCDLMITHGGTNTVGEAIHFGLPMVVLPLFWDQYDNAQRVDEMGFGRRLDTYNSTPEEIRAAVSELLADDDLRSTMRAVSKQVAMSLGQVRAADVIEELVRG